MITFDLGRGRFTYRVAAVVVHDGQVLVCRETDGGFWFLPGGRCEFMESSQEAVKREIREEFGVECQVEHPLLLALGKEPGVRLYGIDYKDDAASARRFLGRYGNPYARIGADISGRTAIDFGVYGVPETYVIGGDGKIAFRHVGPLTETVINNKILPLLNPATSTPEG